MNLVSDSPRANSSRRGSLVGKLSRALGRTPAGTSQALYGADSMPNKVERLLFQLCRFGASELAGKIVARFHAIVQGRTPEPLSANLKLDAQRVDADEEVAQLAYELDPSDVNLERYARSEEKQAYTSTELAMSLRAEQKRRGAH